MSVSFPEGAGRVTAAGFAPPACAVRIPECDAGVHGGAGLVPAREV